MKRKAGTLAAAALVAFVVSAAALIAASPSSATAQTWTITFPVAPFEVKVISDPQLIVCGTNYGKPCTETVTFEYDADCLTYQVDFPAGSGYNSLDPTICHSDTPTETETPTSTPIATQTDTPPTPTEPPVATPTPTASAPSPSPSHSSTPTPSAPTSTPTASAPIGPSSSAPSVTYSSPAPSSFISSPPELAATGLNPILPLFLAVTALLMIAGGLLVKRKQT